MASNNNNNQEIASPSSPRPPSPTPAPSPPSAPPSSRPSTPASDTTNSSSIQREEQTIQENYLPNITRYLEQGTGPRPIVNCPICRASKIVVPGLQERGGANMTGEGEGEEGEFEEPYVLPCGHVFGLDCFAAWAEHKFAERPGEGPLCPTCNAPAFGTPAEREAGLARFAPRVGEERERRRAAVVEMLRMVIGTRGDSVVEWETESDDGELSADAIFLIRAGFRRLD